MIFQSLDIESLGVSNPWTVGGLKFPIFGGYRVRPMGLHHSFGVPPPETPISSFPATARRSYAVVVQDGSAALSDTLASCENALSINGFREDWNARCSELAAAALGVERAFHQRTPVEPYAAIFASRRFPSI